MIAFVLAGASSNVGKTTVSSLIMHGFKERGLTVQGFKCGPDYLDPTFHTFVTGRPSINLDIHLMGEAGVIDAFNRHLDGVDVAVVEGVMGMYDGGDSSLENGSAAHIARLLKIPVVLVVDGSGVATSLAASILGFKTFDLRVDLNGVIVNKLGSKRHYDIVKEPIETYVDINTFGYIPKIKEASFKSRHLGLKPSSEVKNLKGILDAMLKATEETLDFEAMFKRLVIKEAKVPLIKSKLKTNLRLAYALDEAFYFYYHENLEMMRQKGIELIAFSPLNDVTLPENIDGIYIGGGYPELHLEALEANIKIKHQIKALSLTGLPIYAECGGLMYLSKTIVDKDERSFEMVGIFDCVSTMTARLQHFGYVDFKLTKDCILGSAGTVLKGHEFHRSKTSIKVEDCAYEVKKSYRSSDKWSCGIMKKNTLAGYAHLHFKQFEAALDTWIAYMVNRSK